MGETDLLQRVTGGARFGDALGAGEIDQVDLGRALHRLAGLLVERRRAESRAASRGERSLEPHRHQQAAKAHTSE